ncbi:MAG: hypothetical protein R6U15_01015 [Candidatus Izemoplasmatales bacterium]
MKEYFDKIKYFNNKIERLEDSINFIKNQLESIKSQFNKNFKDVLNKNE